ncbi:membrane protein ORF124 [Cyprinid herpesvirus 1]|uniref:Membrane protein ORF124 n=1 Tax=Cyprinid herpesvirus 1 TaxID=317858 RepID=K7PBM3_9VIRU|nr:membrane protein ORF124 [Cyprinid herpesvirus 1]AFJ20411.1 membrane protein ORF124 [Cyprinid herpesvirus 1]
MMVGSTSIVVYSVLVLLGPTCKEVTLTTKEDCVWTDNSKTRMLVSVPNELSFSGVLLASCGSHSTLAANIARYKPTTTWIASLARAELYRAPLNASDRIHSSCDDTLTLLMASGSTSVLDNNRRRGGPQDEGIYFMEETGVYYAYFPLHIDSEVSLVLDKDLWKARCITRWPAKVQLKIGDKVVDPDRDGYAFLTETELDQAWCIAKWGGDQSSIYVTTTPTSTVLVYFTLLIILTLVLMALRKAVRSRFGGIKFSLVSRSSPQLFTTDVSTSSPVSYICLETDTEM